MATRRYKRILTPAELAGPVEADGDDLLSVVADRNLRRPARFRGHAPHPGRTGPNRPERRGSPATLLPDASAADG
jgi:hypothetical protein